MLLAGDPHVSRSPGVSVIPEGANLLSSFGGLNRCKGSQGRSQVSHKAAAVISKGLNSQAAGHWDRTRLGGQLETLGVWGKQALG